MAFDGEGTGTRDRHQAEVDMLANIERIIRPRSVAEAVLRLTEADGSLLPMAGGTATAIFRSPKVKGIVDLWPLPLRHIRQNNGGLVIGATSTMSDLARSTEVRAPGREALGEAAGAVGSSLLRNLITIGGNLVAPYPWADLPPALMVLAAQLAIAGGDLERIPVEEFVSEGPGKRLGKGALVTEVLVPASPASSGSAFIKFAESAVAYSWVDVAVWLRLEGTVCAGCRVAIGAIEPRPRRLPQVEAALEGVELTEESARAAGDLAAKAVQPSHDPRASEEYKRHCLSVLCRRAILNARDRALHGSRSN